MFLVVLAGGAGAGRTARAQAPVSAAEAEADQRFRRGLELYKEGDFAQAAIELKRAYALAPNYKALYNIGLVEYELGEYAAALTTFEKYLADGGAGIPEEKRASVKADIDKLRLRVGRIAIVTKTAGAEVLIDDIPAGKAPLAGLVLVTAGRRRITISQGGRSQSRVVEVAGGEVARVELDLEAPAPAQSATTTSPAAPASTAPPPSNLTWLPWAATGLLAAGAGVTGGLALSASGELAKKRETLGSTPQEREDAAAQVKTLALVTDILGVAAIVGLGVSIGVTVSQSKGGAAKAAAALPWSPAGPQERAAGLRAHIAAGPGGVWLSGSF